MDFLSKTSRSTQSAHPSGKNRRRIRWRKLTSAALCVLLLGTGIVSVPAAATSNNAADTTVTKVADIDTSDGYINLMANESYPGATTSRYAGRIWADKSVFTDKTIIMDKKDFTNDSDFLVASSFLGSTRSITGSEPQPIDLMVLFDCSSSMNADDRIPQSVAALNTLFASLREHSPQSRMSLVTYNGSVTTSIPLGTYEWERNLLSAQKNGHILYGTSECWDINVNLALKTLNSNVRDFSTNSGTFTQGAWYKGMKALSQVTDTKTQDSRGNLVTRQPVVILVTDGEPQTFTSGDWWEPMGATYKGNNYGQPAAILSTILTGAYWSKKVQANYGIDPKIYTIGAGLTGPYYETVLNPGEGLKKADDITGTDVPQDLGFDDSAKHAYTGYAYNAWECYKKNQTFTLPCFRSTEKHHFNHPEDDVTDEDLDYVDGYYSTTFDGLGNIFDQIFQEVQNAAFYATNESTGGEQSAVIYRDQIGEYMEVKDVKGVLWDGTLYNATKQGYDSYSLTLASGETAPKHPITKEIIDISKMTVKVEQKKTNGKTLETLVVEIPNSCLPLRHDEITVKDGEMKDYTSSRFETTPLRVLYTVGIQDTVKVDGEEDGAIDLSKIDAAYKAKNINADGNIQFYSNRYDRQLNPTGDARFDDGAIGDTTVQFTPNENNRYYFFQKNRQIYSDKACKNPVTANQVTNNSLPNGTYYFKIDYYVDNDKTHGYTGTHTGYTETVVERTADQLAGAVEAINDNVYTKIGAARIGRLDYFSRNKEKNATETATYSFVPWMSNNQMTVFLGNNGRLDVPNPYNITISKTVAGSEGDKDKEFKFTVKITDADDVPLTGSYYIGGSVTKPTDGMLTLTNGEGSITLKHGQKATITGLPLDAKYTVTEDDYSGDGYTTTVNGTEGREVSGVTSADTIEASFTNTKGSATPPVNPDPDPKPIQKTGNLTVSKTVAGDAGETNRVFTFKVTLDNASINGKYGDMTFTNGVATITLKHGESKTATGLPDGKSYTVTETEANQDGYVTTKIGDTGTIRDGITATAAFTNTKNATPPEPGTGNLIVSKVVAGNAGDKTKDFQFTVTLGDKAINGKYGDMTFTNGVATITLKHGESKTATGLPVDTTYKVVETKANQDGYTTVATGSSGTITKAGATAAFTNTKAKSTDPSKPTKPTEPTNPGTPANPSKRPIDGAPNTGDESNLSLWLMLMGASCIGVISTLLFSRKRKKREGHNK